MNFIDLFSNGTQGLTDLIYQHSLYAHWIILGALLLAGFNIPISEDLMIITSAILASTIVPENTYKLFICLFLGCYVSDWIAYWLGRVLGPKLWQIKWFAKMMPESSYANLTQFYSKYGFFVLLIGRFIPFGIRNGLFITAGMMRMHFGKFLLSDGIACLISNLTLFSIVYSLGKNYEVIFEKLKVFNIYLFIGFLVMTIGTIVFLRIKKLRKNLV